MMIENPLLTRKHHSMRAVSDSDLRVFLDHIESLVPKLRNRLRRATALADALRLCQAPSDRLVLEDTPCHLFAKKNQDQLLEDLLNPSTTSGTWGTPPDCGVDEMIFDDDDGATMLDSDSGFSPSPNADEPEGQSSVSSYGSLRSPYEGAGTASTTSSNTYERSVEMAMAVTDCDDRRSEVHSLEGIDCCDADMVGALLPESPVVGYQNLSEVSTDVS